MDLKTLQRVGLTEGESKVYLALLRLGQTTTGPIVKKSGVTTSKSYKILARLEEKGLVSSIVKGKKHYFQATDPERLLDLLREKEERLRDILPQLKIKQKNSLEKQEVTVYSGSNGIRNVLEKMLTELGESGKYYDFGVSGKFREVMVNYWDLWQKQKKKLKIWSEVIFTEEIRDSSLVKDYFGKCRFHPKEYTSLTDTMIYLDTVILFIWNARPPIAIVIKNKDNASSYKNQFKMLWKAAHK